ncbi:hypothetical protein SteCoe_33790 [Stentor coeruleus]|uniref:PH domain-containing protein n=1 Tax=Stentor coeruleus TaxID=5963 RepID=A0A1R2AVY0_9CILI|nr:hypothetical protein SteCoe_33790 [Stentor coeruleus]
MNTEKILKQGILQKRTRYLKRWKKVYFIIKKNKIFYYKPSSLPIDEKSELRKIYYLQDYDVQLKGKKKDFYLIKLKHKHIKKRNIMLRSLLYDETIQWIRLFGLLDPLQSNVHFEDLSSFFLSKERFFDKLAEFLDIEIIVDNDTQHRAEKNGTRHLQTEEWKDSYENAESFTENKAKINYVERNCVNLIEKNNQDEDAYDFQSTSKISNGTKIVYSDSESFLEEFDDFLITNREKPDDELAKSDCVYKNDLGKEKDVCRTKSKDLSFKKCKGEDSNVSKIWGGNSKYQESMKSEENSFK